VLEQERMHLQRNQNKKAITPTDQFLITEYVLCFSLAETLGSLVEWALKPASLEISFLH